jgi:predicted dehydrogenase
LRIGVDLQQDRIQKALDKGMDIGLNLSEGSYVEKVIAHTDGFGADGVIVTAASSSDEIMHAAMNACRKKGRVVLVGDVGLSLKREDFYAKELDFFISCSYGPGRYDSTYEEEGQDYPLPYVRWTENRNMDAYLKLLSTGKISLDGYYEKPFPITKATEAYQELQKGHKSPLAVFLEYPHSEKKIIRKVSVIPSLASSSKKIGVGFAGVGGFAQGVHLPNLLKLKNSFDIRGIMSRTGSNAKAVAMQYEAPYATTDYNELLQDETIQLVIISSRHDTHASMALEGLKAGKNVFVEKPLALNIEDLEKFDKFYAKAKNPPLLMVGFNRRFSPAAQRAKEILKKRTTPMIINYRMNAGYIPLDHWVHGKEGGGRNIGEGCHIYDLFNFFTDSKVVEVQALPIKPSGKQWSKNDNFIATFKYEDGSVCSLTYTALGSKDYPKERMDIFSDGLVLTLDDYKSLSVVGTTQKGWTSSSTQKGHEEEMQALAHCLLKGGEWPISYEQQRQATWMSFEAERQLY